MDKHTTTAFTISERQAKHKCPNNPTKEINEAPRVGDGRRPQATKRVAAKSMHSQLCPDGKDVDQGGHQPPGTEQQASPVWHHGPRLKKKATY